MILGQVILAYRRQHKLSRRKLASTLGIDHVTLGRIENGDSGMISLENLQKIITWLFQT